MRCFLTARDGIARLSEQINWQLEIKASGCAEVWVHADKPFQILEGFGGAFTEAAAVTWQKLSLQRQEQVLRDYFDVD
ncbi:MAG: glucosylceramidase, partial [Comamonadaceae bacterium]